MPLKGFLTPNGDKVSLKEAPGWFEENELIPAEAIAALIRDTNDHSRPSITPSSANPQTVCRRAEVLKKYIPYHMMPIMKWAALEGSFWHKFWEGTPSVEGWDSEVYTPDQEGAHDNHPKVRVIEAPWGKTIREVEVFPGWWYRTRSDRLSKDKKRLITHKTVKYPWTPKPKNPPATNEEGLAKWEQKGIEGHTLQASLEAHAIETISGIEIENITLWMTRRGARIPQLTFVHVPLRKMGYDECWGLVKDHVTTLTDYMEQAEALTLDDIDVMKALQEGELNKLIKSIPMDGHIKQLFNGWLCREGCPVREECWGVEDDLLTF